MSRASRRRRRPSVKLVLASAVVVGLLSAFASLMMPVHVTFVGDPILRLQSFEGRPGGPVAGVDCGNAFDGLGAGGGEEPAGIYELARDRACREAATRRALSAGAAGAVLVVVAALALTASTTASERPSSSASSSEAGVQPSQTPP